MCRTLYEKVSGSRGSACSDALPTALGTAVRFFCRTSRRERSASGEPARDRIDWLLAVVGGDRGKETPALPS